MTFGRTLVIRLQGIIQDPLQERLDCGNDRLEAKYSPFTPCGNQIKPSAPRHYLEHDSPDFLSVYFELSMLLLAYGKKTFMFH